MNRDSYVASLSLELDKLGVSAEEKTEILEDFNRHFTDGAAEGLTEEQICEKLGSIHEIARQYAPEAAVQLSEAQPEQQKFNVGGLIGVIWFDILVTSWAVPTIFVLFAAYFVVTLSLAVAGISIVVASIFAQSVVVTSLSMFSVFFLGFIYIALSGLTALLSFKVCKLFLNCMKWFVNIHTQWTVGRKIYSYSYNNKEVAA
jgi:uncharacterized membrane protein